MIDFDITKKEFSDEIGEPGTFRGNLREIGYTIPPIGWDDTENEPIYSKEPVSPEEAEKVQWFRKYRLILMKRTKPSSECVGLSDGLQKKALESPYFDSRDPEADKAAKHMILGLAMALCFEL